MWMIGSENKVNIQSIQLKSISLTEMIVQHWEKTLQPTLSSQTQQLPNQLKDPQHQQTTPNLSKNHASLKAPLLQEDLKCD